MSRPSRRVPSPPISRADRRWWREAQRAALREHDADQMAALSGMAAEGRQVTGVRTPDEHLPGSLAAAPLGTAPVEMIIDGRRLRAGRMSRRSLAALRDALTGIASVPLTAVGRYGPYWVLTFKLAAEPLVVLVDHLALLPDWGGPGGRTLTPSGPLAALGV